MKIFFLDDSESRRKEFQRNSVGFLVDYAKNAEEAIHLLKNYKYDLIYLDHDLEEEHYDNYKDQPQFLGSIPKDGRYVANHLKDYAHNYGAYVVIHSLNKPAADNMTSALKDLFSLVIQIPFAWKISPEDLLIKHNIIDPTKD